MRLPANNSAGAGEVNLGAQGAAIFVLRAIRAGDASKADERMIAQTRELLRERHGEGYFQAFLGNLRKETKIKIYKENL
jgi:hypothetical protein